METGRLAKRIRAFRRLKGFTQIELAQKLGVSISILGAIERGNRMPDDRLLKQISQALGIEVDEIMQERG